jgi:hypothetical protein
MSQEMVKKFVRNVTAKDLYKKMAEGTGIVNLKKILDNKTKELNLRDQEIKQVRWMRLLA